MSLVAQALSYGDSVLDGQSEIQQEIRSVVGLPHDVGGMEVIVGNPIMGDELLVRHLLVVTRHHHGFVPLGMEHGERAANILDETDDFIIRDEMHVLVDVLGQGPAIDILHLDHRPVLDDTGATYPDDVGIADVADPKQQAAFPDEGIGGSLVLADGMVQHFQGADVPELPVADQPDLGHTSIAEMLDQIIARGPE